MVRDSCGDCHLLPLHTEIVFISVAFTVSLNEIRSLQTRAVRFDSMKWVDAKALLLFSNVNQVTFRPLHITYSYMCMKTVITWFKSFPISIIVTYLRENVAPCQ